MQTANNYYRKQHLACFKSHYEPTKANNQFQLILIQKYTFSSSSESENHFSLLFLDRWWHSRSNRKSQETLEMRKNKRKNLQRTFESFTDDFFLFVSTAQIIHHESKSIISSASYFRRFADLMNWNLIKCSKVELNLNWIFIVSSRKCSLLSHLKRKVWN